jgi:hypothetical protein
MKGGVNIEKWQDDPKATQLDLISWKELAKRLGAYEYTNSLTEHQAHLYCLGYVKGKGLDDAWTKSFDAMSIGTLLKLW